MTNLFNPPRLLKTREEADYLKVNKGTLENWRYTGKGPPWVRLTLKTIRYPSDGLNEWLATAEAQATKTVHKGIAPGMVHIGVKLSKADMAHAERNNPTVTDEQLEALGVKVESGE